MVLIFESKFANLSHYEEFGILVMHWHEETKNMSDEDFKALMLNYLKHITKDTKGVLHHMLNNNYILNEEMQNWVDKNINSKGFHLGIRHVAFLITSNLFAQVSVEETMNGNIGKQFISEYFYNEEKALEWLICNTKK